LLRFNTLTIALELPRGVATIGHLNNQAIVLHQIIRFARLAAPRNVGGRCTQHAARSAKRSRHQLRIAQFTIAQCHVHRIAGHILHAVTHRNFQPHTDKHFDELVESLKPQGALALIDDPQSIDVMKLKRKSLSLHWELMFTRSLFDTPDIGEQGALLNKVAALIDQGTLKTTANSSLGRINAENLKRAHAMIESNRAIGKIVLNGF
jgi:Zinc-binding dehydrogenase